MTKRKEGKNYDFRDLDGETWLDVVGYEGLYKASNLGRIKSLKKKMMGRWGCFRDIDDKILMSKEGSAGYYTVFLYGVGSPVRRPVHRLIAEAFIPNPENKLCVNHINGVKTDNRVENLEWCTHSENIQHAHRIGLTNPVKGEVHPFSKITEDQARDIKYGHKKLLLREISDIYGISQTTISEIRHGKVWKHI